MGVMQIIRQQKQRFRSMQQDKSMAHNVAAAEELKTLKEERLRLEGKAKLSKGQVDERERIQQAKQTLRQNSPGMRGARNLANFINKGKTQLKKIKDVSSGSGIDFGGKGLDVGSGGFNAGGGSSPFNTPKKKGK